MILDEKQTRDLSAQGVIPKTKGSASVELPSDSQKQLMTLRTISAQLDQVISVINKDEPEKIDLAPILLALRGVSDAIADMCKKNVVDNRAWKFHAVKNTDGSIDVTGVKE